MFENFLVHNAVLNLGFDLYKLERKNEYSGK